MGKLVILGGNARSGKTTLAFKLVKKGFSRISFDNLQAYLEEGLDIKFDELSDELKFSFLKTIVNKSLEETKNEDTNIVIDMYDYLPHDLEKIPELSKENIYFLIYPNCSKEEIKYNVTHYAKKTDWIAQVNEKYLDECVERFYERNKIILKEFQEYNYRYIDTSCGEKRDLILKKLLAEICNDKVHR